jgi:hypothetical protein
MPDELIFLTCDVHFSMVATGTTTTTATAVDLVCFAAAFASDKSIISFTDQSQVYTEVFIKGMSDRFIENQVTVFLEPILGALNTFTIGM